jgi:hypothetical protein
MKTAAVQNFLGSIDLQAPMIVHFKNAMRDALAYKWDRETRLAILQGIEDAYNKKKDK